MLLQQRPVWCPVFLHSRLYDTPPCRLLFGGCLSSQGGKQVLCSVHLVPIRGGLLALPRLDVMVPADRDITGQGDVSGSGVECAFPTALLVQSFLLMEYAG